MTKLAINENIQKSLTDFLKSKRRSELLATYLHYLSLEHGINPVVFPVGKKIYESSDKAVEILTSADELYRETEIIIRFGQPDANEDTRRIYICPFTGKAFGDNTHPNPQDAIYDWVSKCPENKDLNEGLRVKRFFVSEDSEVIKNYITERKEPMTKKVFSSAINSKLFSSKEAVIQDFTSNYLKPMTLVEIQAQNRFEIEESFMEVLQAFLAEDQITGFVGAMAEISEFIPHVEKWIESAQEEG